MRINHIRVKGGTASQSTEGSGRFLEKSHQLTRRNRQPVHKLGQRLPAGIVGCLRNPRSPMNHAGFFHQASIQLGRCYEDVSCQNTRCTGEIM